MKNYVKSTNDKRAKNNKKKSKKRTMCALKRELKSDVRPIRL